jgi:glycosyltransferase involved in cell wall biosynthesis
MKISVVTVVFNAADTIADTLRSVAVQTYPNIEHIIIDGGSTDGTLGVIKQHGTHIATLVSEPDKGIYDAMNKGWQRATGNVVAFLNADDAYMHNNVVSEAAVIMAQPEWDACHGDLVYVDRQNTDRIVRYWRGHDYAPGDCLKGWMPAHPTFFARRRLFERFGGFNIAYRRQADFDLMLRWFELGHIRTLHVPHVWARMRMGGVSNNTVTGVIKGNLEAYRACKQAGFNVTPFFMLRKIASRLPQYWRKAAV